MSILDTVDLSTFDAGDWLAKQLLAQSKGEVVDEDDLYDVADLLLAIELLATGLDAFTIETMLEKDHDIHMKLEEGKLYVTADFEKYQQPDVGVNL